MAGSLHIIVLAAGASARMGSPKPLLDFDGQPCLEIVLDAAARAGFTDSIVVLGSQATDILAGCRLGRSVAVVVNERFERGQTSSLKMALGALPPKAAGFFIFPVDHPLIEPSDFTSLAARFGKRTTGKSIAIPAFDGKRGHPVLMKASHRETILLLEDASPLHDYIHSRAAEVDLVPSMNRGVVAGVNTPEEYAATLEEFRRRRTSTQPF